MSARIHSHPATRTLLVSLVTAFFLAGWFTAPVNAVAGLRLEESFGPPYPEEWANFGAAVALSRDGNTALLGEPGASCADGPECGSAYLYQRLSGSWTLIAVLQADIRQAAARFGEAVALAGDGQTALVGAPGFDCATGYECGAIHYFSRDPLSGTWSGTPGFSDLGAAGGEEFGAALALDRYGLRALVGMPGRSGGGAVRVLNRDFAGNWSYGGLFWGPAYQGRLGAAVALDDDGSTAVAGAPQHACESGGLDCGTIGVFEPDTLYSVRYFASDSSAGSRFGAAVAFSADASAIVVGAPGYSGCGTSCGRGYLLLESPTYPGEYVETDAFTPPAMEAYDNFGAAVALSSDGSRLAVGAPWRFCDGACGGSLYQMRRVGFSVETTQVIDGTWSRARVFGRSLAISADGGVVLAGDPQEACLVPAGGLQCGGARIYSSLFADDFESGDLSAWSSIVGGS